MCIKNKAQASVAALIPAASLGTRFYPYSKLIPKELLPVNNRPAIDYSLEEIAAAGVKDCYLIANQNKTLMVEYAKKFSSAVKIHPVMQQAQRGLGDAVFSARNVVPEESILAVLLPDNIFFGSDAVTAQMLDYFKLAPDVCGVIAFVEVDKSLVKNYGIAKVQNDFSPTATVFSLEDLVEKPATEAAPSNLAVMGRYIFSPCIFGALENLETGALGEVQLTDAINKLIKSQKKILGLKISYKFLDLGNLEGWLEANNLFFKQTKRSCSSL